MNSHAWHSMDMDAVLQALDSEPHRGLAPEEVRSRLRQYGPNELTQEEKASAWDIFFAQFKNILIIILIVATILSAVVGEYVDAGIIFVIIVFCAVLGFVQEYRAERALEALKGMLAPTITVLRGGQEQEVPSRELVPGDVLVLEAGDKIPADGRLVEIHSLQCDEAPLTGESVPVGKELILLGNDAPVGDRRNMVFTGTIATYGRGNAVVTATDPQLRGAPSGHVINVCEVRLAAGAEFVVMVCGDVMAMPGLPKVPSAEKIDSPMTARWSGRFEVPLKGRELSNVGMAVRPARIDRARHADGAGNRPRREQHRLHLDTRRAAPGGAAPPGAHSRVRVRDVHAHRAAALARLGDDAHRAALLHHRQGDLGTRSHPHRRWSLPAVEERPRNP